MLGSDLFTRTLLVAALLCPELVSGDESAGPTGAASPAVSPGAISSLRQLRQAVSQQRRKLCTFQIEAVVRAVSQPDGWLLLQDDSEAALIEVAWGEAALQPGQRISLAGTNCAVGRHDGGLKIGGLPVVDADGSHPPITEAGTTPLSAGRIPIRVVWFNDVLGATLEVEYRGPGLRRQRIPDSALVRALTDPATGQTNFVAGLNYQCFEGEWARLPDFTTLMPRRTGVTRNFDLRVKTRDERVGLEFTGWLTVPREGDYTFYVKSDDGAQLFVTEARPQLTVTGTAPLAAPRPVVIGQILSPTEDAQWSRVEGEVGFVGEGDRMAELELRAGDSRMRLQIVDARSRPPTQLLGCRVRARGICLGSQDAEGSLRASTLVLPDWHQVEVLEAAPEFLPSPDTNTVLTSAAQVQRLNRDQARQGFAAKLRGVVTYVAPNQASLILQDSTRAIFVTHYAGGWKSGVPRVGELWEIAGVSHPADFAPVLQLKQAKRLGRGRLPDPVRPTWDQLINGSQDAQYVELQGIITDVATNRVTLLTRMGRIEASLLEFPPEKLAGLRNALVRVRGCLFAEWDRETHRVRLNRGVQIGNPTVSVDEAAPANPFEAVRKTAAELLHFDPQASAFQRVRLIGHVLAQRNQIIYLTDDTCGVRVLPKVPISLQPGDAVEVAGLPQLGGPAPVLQEAVLRKTGTAPLPQPRSLSDADLIQAELDSTRVRLEAVLLGVKEEEAEQVLELQSGLRTFVARLDTRAGSVRALKPGSRLELTGVYAGIGGGGAEGREISSFEVLLNSPGEIRVLARPPWWTPARLLMLAGALLGVLVLALGWINVLRRQVEKRGELLKREIQEREQAEQRHAIEAERTRIARDIHDELGCSLAQIRLLSEMTLAPGQPSVEVQASAGKISGKALEAARAMDEIVWAVDPQHDTLESLLSYLCNFASDYLSLAGIRFRIDAPTQVPPRALKTQARHHLFMAIKESLNNVVNHSGASEVWLRFRLENGAAQFLIEDNGRGFERTTGTEAAPGASGLINMRKRLGEIGGECVMESATGQGTRVKFTLPLGESKNS